ncbi:hypothetical protein [uncultured Sphingomonas sp.]|uniref:hypothetical protein n=1 Tax=uncultured Sphingomonas sp. TaxID=158754 RepID=UPI003748A090
MTNTDAKIMREGGEMRESEMDEAIFIPRHEASFQLTHNSHKDVYETAAQFIEGGDDYHGSLDNWVSPEQRQLAIDTGSIWTAHWYPDTPIGFHVMHAAELSALSAYLREHFA